MTYRVEISRRAAKAVTGLDKPVRRKVLAAIGALSGDPRPVGCKKLAGQETWRIRVGDYRILYAGDRGRHGAPAGDLPLDRLTAEPPLGA